MNVWASCREVEAVHINKAEECLQKILNDPGMKPDVITWTTLIKAHARHRDGGRTSAIKAEEYLNQMRAEGMEPNVKTWSAVIQAWCACSDESVVGAVKAEDLMYNMMAAGIKPTSITLNKVLNALAKCGNSEVIVARMEQCIEKLDRAGVKPDLFAWTLLLKVWTRSGNPIAGTKVLAIVDRICSRKTSADSTPAVIAWNIAINAWAEVGTEASAGQAESLLQTMSSRGIKPDATSWNIVIKAYVNCVSSSSSSEDAARKAEQWWCQARSDHMEHGYQRMGKMWHSSSCIAGGEVPRADGQRGRACRRNILEHSPFLLGQ
jgi:PPR repeat family